MDPIGEYPAAHLLLERASRPRELSRREAAAVAEVVTRLDGLPLAIELAATKLRWVPAEELARSMRERLSLLYGPNRAAPARQRSLESAIAWSHDLVSESERVVLRRLAVFPGSFDAAAAEAVAGGYGLTHAAGLPALASLVQASLLAVQHERATTRYRLLQTVRVYARERLRQAGEQDGTARRHRDAYLGIAGAVGRNMRGPGLPVWLPRARREHENLQAALHWSLERGDAAEALQLAAHIWWYWFRVGNVAEGRALLERALLAAAPTSPLRHMALLGRAFLAHAAGTSDALPVARASVAACNAAGGDWPLGYALCMEARALTEHGRLERARAAIARAQSLFDATGEQEGIAFADQLLGGVHLRAGQLDAAERLLLSARERFRRLRGDLDAGYTLIDLARVALAQRRPSDATEHATQALVDFRRRGDPRGVSGALLCLGRANGLLGDEERARPLLDEALALARRWGYPVNAAEAESALARLTTSARLGVGGEEPELGARVEALGAHDVAALPGVGEQRDGDVRVAEKLR